MLRKSGVIFCALSVSLWSVAAEARPSIPQPFVSLQALNKITARVSELQARVGESARFGALLIEPQTCMVTPPTEAPESAAFLQIKEILPGSAEERGVFSGWMFASSPGLSAMDHPVYDVWVMSCLDAPKGN